MKIEKGMTQDVDELERLYDDLNDYLAANINYPGWKKGIYPVRETAENGIAEGNLYVARTGGRIAGSLILTHKPEAAYAQAKWNTEDDYDRIFVIKTFVVNPEYFGKSAGKSMLDFACALAVEQGIVSIRLDAYESNIPAIRLYEKNGFKYVDTVDLGIGETYGLKWFRLYEKVI